MPKELILPDIKDYTAVNNIYIQALMNLSTNAFKIIGLLATQVKKGDTKFEEVKITIKDLAELFEIDKSNVYRHFKDSVREILKIHSESERHGKWKAFNWLDKAEIDKGTATLKFSKEVKPVFLLLENNWSQIVFLESFKFERQSTIRVFLFLCRWKHKNRIFFTLENFKAELDLPKKSYKEFRNLKNRYLQPAQDEIHDKTNIRFEWKIVKSGRKIDKIIFSIFDTEERSEDIIELFEDNDSLFSYKKPVLTKREVIYNFFREIDINFNAKIKENLTFETLLNKITDDDLVYLKTAADQNRLKQKSVKSEAAFYIDQIINGKAHELAGKLKKFDLVNTTKQQFEETTKRKIDQEHEKKFNKFLVKWHSFSKTEKWEFAMSNLKQIQAGDLVKEYFHENVNEHEIDSLPNSMIEQWIYSLQT